VPLSTLALPLSTFPPQGETGGDFYIVKSGSVQMSYETTTGKAVRTRTYGPGECFGASGALGAGGASAARRNTATALEEVTLYKLPHRHLMLLMREDKNAMSSFENVVKTRQMLTRHESYSIDKIHLRDEEAFMHTERPPREAFEED
jgi:CRP-like cAMP-binding protein